MSEDRRNMDQTAFADFWVEYRDFLASNPTFDPAHVRCDECGRVGPVHERAMARVMDETPEKILGGGTVGTLFYCPECLRGMLGGSLENRI